MEVNGEEKNSKLGQFYFINRGMDKDFLEEVYYIGQMVLLLSDIADHRMPPHHNDRAVMHASFAMLLPVLFAPSFSSSAL